MKIKRIIITILFTAIMVLSAACDDGNTSTFISGGGIPAMSQQP